MIFMANISKGHNSVKNISGVAVLVLCTLSDDDLYLYKFQENILHGIKVIERTRFSYQQFRRGIIP